MENKRQNNELQSRREFFKHATQMSLPEQIHQQIWL